MTGCGAIPLDPAVALTYGGAVAARFAAPAHAGRPDGTGWLSGEAGRVPAGVTVRIWLRGDTAGGVTAARFEAFGDPAVIAAADWLCDEIAGRPLTELGGLTARRISEALAIPAAHMDGTLVVEDALAAAAERLAAIGGRSGDDGGCGK
ncbi:iron-sulfur cluster assembly scaffold protein [Arhodomonas aquaeolei]|uniref:iron-sulfur cluster assembly scaffold protein n=1 Tax=Arhodomonas aquaeolei TaxID=2369 RepID=UPI0009FBB7D9|nr:iron-sulfur cluster assembly scaffold protein [Arhodomonas aquaeolei]